MDRQHSMPLLVLALVVVAPLTAEAAAGTITGLTVSPSTVTAGAAVTIQIQGSGTCGAGTLVFGDGNPTQQLINLPLPYTTTHPYSTVAIGILTVTAKGVTNCKGTKSAQLTVQSPSTLQSPSPQERALARQNLGLLVSQIRRYAPPPTITQVVPFVSNPTPGGGLIVQGTAFGSRPGRLVLTLRDRDGGPHSFDLQKLEWGNTFAGGIIPAGISGVVDQGATVKIIDQFSVESEPKPLGFRATRDVVQLPGKAFRVECSPDASYNHCWATDSNYLAGVHDAVLSEGNYGIDIWTPPLFDVKNGWVFDSYWIDVDGDASLNSFVPGSGPSPLWVNWEYGAGVYPSVNYTLGVYVSGPVGVPMFP